MFKLQSPSKYSPFKTIQLSRCFSHCSKRFLNSLILMPFSFLFHLFHISKTLPFEDFFHQGKLKKVAWDKNGWIGRVKHRGHAVFGQKLLNTQYSMGRCAHKSPIMKWANASEKSSKKIHRCPTQPLTTLPLVHWLIQMGSYNTQWGKPVLQRACPPGDNSGFFAASPIQPFENEQNPL